MITESQLKALLDETDNGKVILLRLKHIEIMGSVECGLILSQLLYWKGKKNPFWKTNKELVAETHCSIKQVIKAKNILKKLPFFKITKKGIPAKTWYKFDYTSFVNYAFPNHELLDTQGEPKQSHKVSQNDSSVEAKTTHLSITEITTEINNTSPHKVDEGFSKDFNSSWEVKFAIHLEKTIRKFRKISNTSRIKLWAKSIKKLYTIEKVPRTRIKTVLKWYCKQLPKRYKDKWFIEAYSGSAFREKFLKIEAAIDRDTENTIPEKIKLKGEGLALQHEIEGQFTNLGLFNEELENHIPLLMKKIAGSLVKIRNGMRTIILACELQQDIERKQTGMFTSSEPLDEANSILDEFASTGNFLCGYFQWVAEKMKGFDGYGNTLKSFMPGEKHFKSYFLLQIRKNLEFNPCPRVLQSLKLG